MAQDNFNEDLHSFLSKKSMALGKNSNFLQEEKPCDVGQNSAVKPLFNCDA